MATTITLQTTISVTGGLSQSTSRSINVEAFEVIQVSAPGADAANPAETDVDVQPSDAVQFLSITSDRYSSAPNPEHLTFSVDDGGGGGVADVPLDAEQFFSGQGVVKLLGAPKKLKFKNGLGVGNDANITILVGRDATP